MEEKYGKSNATNEDDQISGPEESSSEDESEDDEGLLATRDVDVEIMDTLNAIRSKDPRIYDGKRKFYKDFDPDAVAQQSETKEKPMYLHDYHRKNLMEGYTGDGEDVDQQQSASYKQKQDFLKKQLLQQTHAANGDEEVGDNDSNEDEDGENFLKAKPPEQREGSSSATKGPEKEVASTSALDPTTADRDPETYLSNFMVSRAWVPDTQSRWQPFDSDDSEDEARADAFEEAYNMRFEDPEQSNEKLMSHAREVASKYSVRREEPKGRKKAREKERTKKEEARLQREEEKARLRKLRIEGVEDRVKKIKEAAGLKSSDTVDLAGWERFLDEGWDDEKWEDEMKKRFDEKFYAENDGANSENDAEGSEKRGSKFTREPRKPTWDDDIDIKDLVPEYQDDETTQPAFTLTDDEDADASGLSEEKPKSKKDRVQSRADAKRAMRKERRHIEALVDTSLQADPSFLPPSGSSKAKPSTAETPRFRYRETSPSSFGLTARDILLANDAQLNQFAGLKKMAAFRDPERKRKDKKRLGKKARLREWRRETFGDPDGPKGGFQDDHVEPANGDADGSGQAAKRGKKKRGKKKNQKTVTG